MSGPQLLYDGAAFPGPVLDLNALENRAPLAWLHTPRRGPDRLIEEIVSEPLVDEPLDERDLT